MEQGLYFCLCEEFKLWYVEDNGIRVCYCGHPVSEHIDFRKSCTGEVYLNGPLAQW